MKRAQIEANESLDDSESSLILDSEDISVSESWLIDENVVSIFFLKVVSYVASVGITHECATRRDKKNRPRAAMPLYVLTLMGMTFAGCWAYGRSWAPDNKRP